MAAQLSAVIAADLVAKFARRAWDWSIVEFAAALKKPDTDVWVREQFLKFQRAGDALRGLDQDVLAVLLDEA